MHEERNANITIRPFDKTRDTEKIKAIAGEVWSGGDDALMEAKFGIVGGRSWNDWIAQSVLSYLTMQCTKSFVAQSHGETVGFCSYLIDKHRKRGTVGYNAVTPNQQGKGIGSMMLEFVVDRLRTENMEHAVVMVAINEEHAPARRIYEKNGFHKLMACQLMAQKLTA